MWTDTNKLVKSRKNRILDEAMYESSQRIYAPDYSGLYWPMMLHFATGEPLDLSGIIGPPAQVLSGAYVVDNRGNRRLVEHL